MKKLLGTAIYDKLAAADGGIEVNEEGQVTALRVFVKIDEEWNELLTESERESLTFDIQALKSLPQLTYFALGGTGVTGDIQALKSLPQLTNFDLSNTGVTGDIQALKSLPQLTTFHLNNTGVTWDKDAFHAHRASAGLKKCRVYM